MPILNTISQIIEAVREFVTTPVGAFASQVFVLSTFIGLVGTKVLQLITKWRLLRSDTQIGFTNMFRLIRGGWQGATLDLQNYMRLQGLLNAQTTYGLPYYASMAKHLGTPVGGVVYDQRTKRWRSHDQSVTGLGKGTFMKERDAIRYTETHGTGKQVVSGFFGTGVGATTTGTQSTWGKLLGLGSKLFGVLSLVSLGAMILVPLVKMVANAIKGNTEEVKKNTYSVNTLAGRYATEQERLASGKSLDLAGEVRLLRESIEKFNKKSSNQTLTLRLEDLNGKEIARKIVDLNDDSNQTNGIKVG